MYSTVLQKIRSSQNVFLTSHPNCPDAIGSLCALSEFLKKRGKKTYSYLSNSIPNNFKDITFSEEIKTEAPSLSLYDLFLIVDAGDLKQTGLEKELNAIINQKEKQRVIAIDHHQTTLSFGHINIIDKNASSTCEILYDLFQSESNPPAITQGCADSLLMGIVSDTGNFTNAATTEKAFNTAAELIWRGANIFHCIQRLYSTEESVNTLRLWGTIFERLTYNSTYDIATSYVLQEDLRVCNVKEEVVEVVANLLNYIRGIKAGVLIKEKSDGTFKVSLRSTYPGVDVSRLAKLCGGGGHKKAAGFTVNRLGISL